MIWKVLLVGFFAVIGGGVYGVFFTSLPAKLALQMVPADHLKIEQIEGSMLSGFKFKGIWADTPNFKLELEEFEMDYSVMENLGGAQQVVQLDALVAKNGVLELKPKIYEKTEGQHNQQPAGNDTNEVAENKEVNNNQPQGVGEIHTALSIVKINFENLRMIVPANPANPLMAGKDFLLNEYSLNNMIFKIDYKTGEYYDFKYQVGKNILRTEHINFELHELVASNKGMTWKDFSLNVGAGVHEKVVGDVDLSLSGKIDWTLPNMAKKEKNEEFSYTPNIELKGFKETLYVHVGEDKKFNINAKGFSPKDFIAGVGPFHDIHFTTSIDNPMMLMMGMFKAEGSKFKVGEVEFIEVAPEPVIERSIASVPEEGAQDNPGAAQLQALFGAVPAAGTKFQGQWNDQLVELELPSNWAMAFVTKGGHGIVAKYQSAISVDEFASAQGIDSSYFQPVQLDALEAEQGEQSEQEGADAPAEESAQI